MDDRVRFSAAPRVTFPTTTPARLAVVVGALLVTSGLVHGVVFLVSGDPFSGPLSFRKPASFGISFGLTVATLGLIVDRMNLRHGLKWSLLTPLSAAATYEVAWVSVQRWRGVPSHFAEGGADETAWAVAGIAIAVVGLCVLGVTIASFACLHEPAALAWGIRAGLIVLFVAQGLGGLLIEAAEQVPAGTTRQEAVTNLWKVGHFVAMHAVQVVPGIALLGLSRVPGRALRAVRVATVGYVLLVTATAMASTTLRVDPPTSLTVPVAVVGLGLIVAAGASVLRPESGPYSPLD